MAQETNGYISRGNMTVIISAAGLVMIAFGGFITFQNSAVDRRISDLKEEIARIEMGYLRKDEHIEFKENTANTFRRIDADILLKQKDVVPRKEHEARWGAISKDISLLSERLNELRSATASTYTMRDELTSLRRQQEELNRHLLDVTRGK